VSDDRLLASLPGYDELPRRLVNVLHSEGIETVVPLCTRTSLGLLCFRNFGQTALQAAKDWLARLGLHLADEGPSRPVCLACRETASVFADWLEEHGEPVAAAMLRQAFALQARRPGP
jgi:hypothetical protein